MIKLRKSHIGGRSDIFSVLKKIKKHYRDLRVGKVLYMLRRPLILPAFVILCLILLPALIIIVSPGDGGVQSPPFYQSGKVFPPKAIKVYRTASAAVEEVPFEEYVIGVVSSEMPASFEMEALKAQAVAARTYSLSKVLRSGDGGNPQAHTAAPLCDSTHCQAYRSQDELSALKGESWKENGGKKIKEAVNSTAGEMIYYEHELISQALFHSSSGGRTENSEDVFVSTVPYLRSVDSPFEDEATHKNEQTVMSVSSFSSAVKRAFPDKNFGSITAKNIKITENSAGGRVIKMQIGDASLSGRDIRSTMGLASADFIISMDSDTITFTSNGSGHGVGLSQYGANGMAKKGYDYKKILRHYYTGVDIY